MMRHDSANSADVPRAMDAADSAEDAGSKDVACASFGKRYAPGTKSIRGKLGEDLGVAWLTARGMQILQRNFRCKIGEIDIIGQEGDMLVFVEVRGRSRGGRGSPVETVGPKKRQKLRRVAAYYLALHGKFDEPCRFDVVSIVYDGGAEPTVDWIINAF